VIFLIDSDNVQEANRDVMRLPVGAVGMPKPLAVACMMKALYPDAQVVPVVGTISDRQAAEAVALSHLTVSCVDRNASRLAVAALCSRYNRVHLDLAGGGTYTQSGAIAIGGEVRLYVPGSGRGCVGCFGDRNVLASMQELDSTAGDELHRRLTNPWQLERPGSCGALLYSVAGTAMHLLWRLLQGHQRDSVWLHLDANDSQPIWHDWTGKAWKQICPICRLNGAGDWHE